MRIRTSRHMDLADTSAAHGHERRPLPYKSAGPCYKPLELPIAPPFTPYLTKMSSPAPFGVILHTPQTALTTCQPFTLKWDYSDPSKPLDDIMYLKFNVILHGEDGRGYALDPNVPLASSGGSFEWSKLVGPPGTYHISVRIYTPPGEYHWSDPLDTYTKTERFEVKEGEDTSCISSSGLQWAEFESPASSTSSSVESTDGGSTVPPDPQLSSASVSERATSGEQATTVTTVTDSPNTTPTPAGSASTLADSPSNQGSQESTLLPANPTEEEETETNTQEPGAASRNGSSIMFTLLGGVMVVLGLAAM